MATPKQFDLVWKSTFIIRIIVKGFTSVGPCLNSKDASLNLTEAHSRTKLNWDWVMNQR